MVDAFTEDVIGVLGIIAVLCGVLPMLIAVLVYLYSTYGLLLGGFIVFCLCIALSILAVPPDGVK